MDLQKKLIPDGYRKQQCGADGTLECYERPLLVALQLFNCTLTAASISTLTLTEIPAQYKCPLFITFISNINPDHAQCNL